MLWHVCYLTRPELAFGMFILQPDLFERPGNFLKVTRWNCLPTIVKKNASDLVDDANTLHHSFTWIFGYDAMVGITRSKVNFFHYADMNLNMLHTCVILCE